MNIEKMSECHRKKVLEMSEKFYSSDALEHEVSMSITERNIDAAIGLDSSLMGYVFIENGEVAGFSYISSYYETEVGGKCVMTLDLYVDEKYRGNGYATKFFEFIFEKYSDAKRFRLEAVKSNTVAIKLYKKMGYREISYGQMVIDKV